MALVCVLNSHAKRVTLTSKHLVEIEVNFLASRRQSTALRYHCIPLKGNRATPPSLSYWVVNVKTKHYSICFKFFEVIQALIVLCK